MKSIINHQEDNFFYLKQIKEFDNIGENEIKNNFNNINQNGIKYYIINFIIINIL